MAYQTNRFCWHGLITTDVAKTSAFYPEVLGWKLEEAPMGDGTATMFSAGGVPFAHYMAPPMPGMPTFWENYLRVDDVAATTEAAVKNGSKVLMAPTDIPPGRFSVITSPSGAVLSLFHEADPETAQHHPGGLGGVYWVELHSHDVDADLKWLKATFGFEIGEMPMDKGGTYYLLNVGQEGRGGVVQAMEQSAPSMWLTWFQVDDVDAAFARVKQHGGQAYTEVMEMTGVGRMAVVADPTGGVFGIIQAAKKG